MDYRAFLLDSRGHFSRAIPMDCRDDQHAIQTVKDHHLDVRAELWQLGRRVALIEPEARR